MTEAEAKQRWCPMVRIPTPKGVANRVLVATVEHSGIIDGHLYEPLTHCIGSACMMWVETHRRNVPTGKDIVVKTLKDGKSWNQLEPETIIEISGHCGLAGKP